MTMLLQPFRLLARPVIIAVLVAGSLLSGCVMRTMFANDAAKPEDAPSGLTQTVEESKMFGILPIYRPDIQQGNFISREMIEQLKVGMTREQVRFLLGTPLVVDAFRDNRWDYPFRLKRGDGTVTSSHVAVIFDQDGRVVRFEGGDLPEEKEYLQRLAAPKAK
jgi:outer membrane protein assembly factor BamE